MIVMSEWNGGPGSAGQFDGRGGHVGGGGVGHAPPAGAPQYHPHHHPLAAAAGVSAQCQVLNDPDLQFGNIVFQRSFKDEVQLFVALKKEFFSWEIQVSSRSRTWSVSESETYLQSLFW